MKKTIVSETDIFPKEWKKDPNIYYHDNRIKQKETPRFTIITITYNCLEFVDYTILSVLNSRRTRRDIEYIVIDGGSTDGTFEKLKSYQNEIDLLFSGNDSGISEAFNRGLYFARGDIISILNAGDSQTPNCLEEVSAAYEQGADLIYGSSYKTDFKSGLPIGYIQSAPWSEKENGTPFLHSAVFIDRNLHLQIGGYQTQYKYAMDIDLLYRAFSAAKNIACLGSALTLQRVGGASHINYKKALYEYYKINLQNSQLSKSKLLLKYYLNCLKRKIKATIRDNSFGKFAYKRLKRLYLFLINNVILGSDLVPFRLFLLNRLGLKSSKSAKIKRGVHILNPMGVKIGERSFLNRGSTIDGRGAGLLIGNDVDIAEDVIIWTMTHSIDNDDHAVSCGFVQIEDHAWIGCRSIIMPGIKVGRGAVVVGRGRN